MKVPGLSLIVETPRRFLYTRENHAGIGICRFSSLTRDTNPDISNSGACAPLLTREARQHEAIGKENRVGTCLGLRALGAVVMTGDGRDEERPSRSEQRTAKKPNDYLTEKAPYKFESAFLQRRVS